MTCPLSLARYLPDAPLCYCWEGIPWTHSAVGGGSGAPLRAPEIDTTAGMEAVMVLALFIFIIRDRPRR